MAVEPRPQDCDYCGRNCKLTKGLKATGYCWATRGNGVCSRPATTRLGLCADCDLALKPLRPLEDGPDVG